MENRGIRLVVAQIICLLVLYSLRPFIFHTDDAFITYQFAQNLSKGIGYVYHPQFLPLQGSSSPLHVVLLALLGAILPVSVDEIGFFLGALGAGFLAFALLELALSGADSLRPKPITWLIAATPLTFFTASMLSFGLEVVWAALALVLLGASVAKGRAGWAVTTAVLMILIRPDWAFFLVPAGLAAMIFQGWRTVLWWIPASIGITLYFYASYLYFGEALPFTWIAKLYIPKEISGVLSWVSFSQTFWGAAVSLATYTLIIILASLGWHKAQLIQRRLMLVYLLMLGFAIAYTLILRYKGAPMMPWYFVSVVAIASALAMVALSMFSKGLLIMCVPMMVVAHFLAFANTSQVAAAGINKRGHEDRREAIGRWLAENDPKINTRSVVAFEVGKIAFYSQAKVYDILGLISREGVEGMKLRDPSLLVRKIQPDYVVGCDCPNYFPMSFLKDPRFSEKYKVVFSMDDYRVWKRSNHDNEELKNGMRND